MQIIFTKRLLILITRYLLASVAIATTTPTTTLADTHEFEASFDRIITRIGVGKQNRIEFEHSKILEVIGNSNQYNIIPSNTGKYIFIVPKANINKHLEISIVYGDNKVQELSLLTGDIEGQSIFIKQATDVKLPKQTKPLQHSQELAQIIRYMALGKIGKYDVTEPNNKLPDLVHKDLKLIFDQKYSFDRAKLIGRRLKLKNTSNKTLTLKEESFAHIFENIIAVNLSSSLLKARGTGFVYLISKQHGENT